jgi:hypothetical protein
MGVEDPDEFMVLAERSDELIVRRLAVLDGSFAIVVEAEGYPAEKIELSGAELDDVCAILLRAIDREQAEVGAGLRDQGVEFKGTITGLGGWGARCPRTIPPNIDCIGVPHDTFVRLTAETTL